MKKVRRTPATPPLAYCEYVAPDGVAVERARSGLMRRVKKVFPEMLQRLSSDVFPAYEALVQTGFDLDAILFNDRVSPFTELDMDLATIELRWKILTSPLPSDTGGNPTPPGDQDARASYERQLAEYRRRRQLALKVKPTAMQQKCVSLRDALSKWAKRFHAEQDWFLDHMLRTLRGWHVAPDWRSELRCNPIGRVMSVVATGEPFQFDCEGWEMQTLTWARYSQSVRARFEQFLSKYETASRTLAESHGLRRGPHKYSVKNFDWFVCYQFAGLSSGQIADQSNGNIDDSSILKGVKAAQRLIGWDTLRPKSGRPNRKIR